MADVLLPTWLHIARLRTDYTDNTGMTRALYTRDPETTGFGGDRLRLSLEFTPTGTSSTQQAMERAALRSFLARLRGRQNRAYLWDPSYRGPRGSFSAPELLPNNTFANGTTTWNAGSELSISVADRVLRVQRNAVTAAAGVSSDSVTVVQYAPYALRGFSLPGRGIVDNVRFTESSVGGADDFPPGRMHTQALVAQSTSISLAIRDENTSGITAGDYFLVPYTSVARCALVDNGPNLLLHSDDFTNTGVWGALTATGLSGVTANAITAADGTLTADSLIENGANSTHRRSQDAIVPSAAGDFSFSVEVKAGARTWAYIFLEHATGSASVWLNLATGAVGSTGPGTDWTNPRSFVESKGNGWYVLSLVARKTSAATTVRGVVGLSTGNSVQSYTGDGTSNIYARRATLAPSSVPTRPAQTTTTASSGTSQTGGALHIKGLLASTSGLLLPDDRFEIRTSRGSEMKIVTASLDSDAAQRGYLQFEPPLQGTPADGAAIIVNTPMTRAIFAGDMVGWDDSPGILTTASAEFEEA